MIVASHRLATEADLPRMLEIYNGVIDEGGFTADLIPQTLEQRRAWFEAHRQAPYLAYVVEIDRAVVGYFYLSPWRPGRAALREVAEVSYYLAREVRGRGLGRAMLEDAMQLAVAAGLRCLLAILLEINAVSCALLEKQGFVLAGRLPDVANLGERRCGQLIMYKSLQEGDK